MTICEEMKKLRELLDYNKIRWIDQSEDFSSINKAYDFFICRTHFEIKGIFFSVINGMGTYGGYSDIIKKDNKGLLELQVDNDDVIGYLTADEVMEILDCSMEDKDVHAKRIIDAILKERKNES